MLIWETIAMKNGVSYKDLSVVFTDVQFYGEAIIESEVPLRLGILIHKGDNKFQINHNNMEIVTGTIQELKPDHKFRQVDEPSNEKEKMLLNNDDIYRIMHRKGYTYKDEFRSIYSSNASRNQAHIQWNEKWVLLLDSLIQLNALARDYDGVSKTKLIRKLTINMEEHNKCIASENTTEKLLFVRIHELFGVTRCAGVEMEDITFTDLPKMATAPDVLETRLFVPHFLTGDISMEGALQIDLQIISENLESRSINIYGENTKIINELKHAIGNISYNVINNKIEVVFITDESVKKDGSKPNVILVENLFENQKKIHDANITSNKFVLALEKGTNVVTDNITNYNIITMFSIQRMILVLLKRIENKVENIVYLPIVHDMEFGWVKRVQEELATTKQIILYSERQPYCGILGFMKNLSKEDAKKINVIVIDDYKAPSFDPENEMFKKQISKNLKYSVLKKGQWGGYYNIPSAKSTNLRSVNLISTSPGDLDSLTWVEAVTRPPSTALVQVCYAGISYRDVQKAAGEVKQESECLGMDFSGIDSMGEKVMGLLPGGSLSSTVEADEHLLWPVPSYWTLEDAATVPMAYTLAYYCLAMKSSLREGMTVFVNGGAGALGQAIINICLSTNCTVYTTVSDLKKKEFLLKLFPQLTAEHIGDSRNPEFSTTVIKHSENNRCDIVINCQSGILRQAAMKCAGFTGFVLDLSDYDILANEPLGLHYLVEEKTYRGVNFSSIWKPENIEDRKMLKLLVSEGINNGAVKPLTRVVYSPLEVIRAFRLIASSKQRGKVLIRLRDPSTLNQGVNVIPRMSYSDKDSYVVVCDNQKVGIEFVDQLIKNGAKNIMVHINNKAISGYFCYKLGCWKKHEVAIRINSENLQTENGCINLINEAARLGPVHGIFVVQDCHHENETKEWNPDKLKNTFIANSLIVANLDVNSRNLCSDLSYFVVVSQTSENVGDEYSFAASEKICQSRSDAGLPALHIRLELVDQMDLKKDSVLYKPQALSTAFSALETSLKLNYNNTITYDLKKKSNCEFLNKICRVLGVNKFEDIPEDVSLDDLKVSKVIMEEIQKIIKDTYNLSYNLNALQNMPISSFKTLSDNVNYQKTNFDSGLNAFISFIDIDECLATEAMVPMTTRVSKDCVATDELDDKATYVMLIPGFEGHHQIFTRVCERLKIQAMTFQLGPDLTYDSVQEMASKIMTFIKNRFELKSKFYLLGYSFGINVTLELAALMEKEGHVGIVYCLDSSPDALRAQLDAYLGHLTNTQLQNLIIEHIYRLMTGTESEELKHILQRSDTWEQKVFASVNRLRSVVKYSNQYKKYIIEMTYNRIMLARQYEPNFKLDSELILLKGIPHPNSVALPYDYNLSKYTTKPVKIFDLESDHAMAPQDCRVGNIVNRFLDPKLLEDFEKQNLCELYLMSSFKVL